MAQEPNTDKAKSAEDLAAEWARELIDLRNTALAPNGSIGLVRRYLRGDHDLPYMPKKASNEYMTIARNSITNWLPLISDTFAKNLWVDGYRAKRAADNARAWQYWQANKMDARQAIAHRGALEYGVSYVSVLPGADGRPVITPLAAHRTYALYQEDDDDWPMVALYYRGTDIHGDELYYLWESNRRWDILVPTRRTRSDSTRDVDDRGTGSGDLKVLGYEEHPAPYVPWVRFRERLDGTSEGVIKPLIPTQNRINETVFSAQMALQYAAFRQRWATGMAIPRDTEEYLPDGVTPNPNYGKPIEPFKAAVDRLWVVEDPEARFGEFSQTDVTPHIQVYREHVKTLAAIGQVSPLVMMGDLVNLSADALSSIQDATQRKLREYETNFGESWEQVFALAAYMAGEEFDDEFDAAEVRWRDTEARSLAATVDALGKMVQMLHVPAEELWDRIPGATDQDVERWRETARSAESLIHLMDRMSARQEEPTEDMQDE
jgi:hypothetical protein